MARPLRIEYPGAYYHVTCRGNDRRAIFLDEADRKDFLNSLGDGCGIYRVGVHAYVLMGNHLHLVVHTEEANLGEFMRRLLISYTGRFNRRHRRSGHLFQGRYGAVLVDQDAYLLRVVHYVHLNPIRTRGAKALPGRAQEKRVLGYAWSSLPGYVNAERRVGWLDCGMVLAQFGGDTELGRRTFRKRTIEFIYEKGGMDLRKAEQAGGLLGSGEFLRRVRRRIQAHREREIPARRRLQAAGGQEEVWKALKEATGEEREVLKQSPEPLRGMAMELLYRWGGLRNVEIAAVFGLDYSTVSVLRKRLREHLRKDPATERTFRKAERLLMDAGRIND